jgi:alkylation response protein AidB-like acyl-CoA dehydrogenase
MTDLLYSDVEDSLRESVRSTITRHLDPAAVAALYDAPDTDVSALWTALGTDLGLAGLIIPEKLCGAGATAREAAVVLEEIGRAVAPVPFLTSSVIATTLLLAAGDNQYLPGIADGSSTAVLVLPWSARRGGWSPVSESAWPVAGALEADLFLVPVEGTDGLDLRVLSAGQVEIEPVTSFDMSRRLARVTPRARGDVLMAGAGARDAVDQALAAGQALLASEQYGVAKWCLETTVDYVKTRVQFARPIGSFQAVKHRLADLYLEVVQAQAAARYAAATLADDDADQSVARSVAQSYCSDVAVHAAEEAVQLHGGIGMTWEYPVHLYLKRAKSDQLALGTPARHRSDLAGLVGLSL